MEELMDSFEEDLEAFRKSLMVELDRGLEDIKLSLKEKEYKLRSDLHSSVSGFVTYMRDKYRSNR